MSERKKGYLNFPDSKSGNVGLEVIIIVACLMAFAIIIIMSYVAYSAINTEIQADLNMTAESRALIQQSSSTYPSQFDNAFIFVFAIFWIFAIASALLIDSHPVFLFITIIILVVLGIASLYLGQFWTEFTSDSDISSLASSFPKMSFILQNLLKFVIAIGATIALSLYGKRAGGG